MPRKRKPPRRSQQAKDRLILASTGLVGACVKRLYRSNARVRRLGRDEALSVGMLALVKAATWFDPKFGVLFSTYAYNSIYREVVRAAMNDSVVRVPEGAWNPKYSPACHAAAEQAQRVWHIGLAEQDREGDDGKGLLFAVGDPVSGVDSREALEGMLAAVCHTWQYREAAKRFWLMNWSTQRIGDYLAVSKMRVQQVLTAIVRRLRKRAGMSKEEVAAPVSIGRPAA